MPYYGKKRRGRRRQKRSKPWYAKKYSALQLAGKAVAGVRYIKRIINVEKKKFDLTQTLQTTNEYVAHLTAIPQGDTAASRDGNSILLQYVTIRGRLYLNASSSLTNHRIVVIKDNQQVSDTAPAVADLLEGTAGADFTIANMELDNVGRFTKLYDQVHQLQEQYSGSSRQKNFIINIPINKHVRYNGAAGTDIQKGGLYIMVMDDQATYHSSVTFNSRVVFTDN